MDMYGITEDNDDNLDRDYSADPILHNSNHELTLINQNRSKNVVTRNSPIETPNVASQIDISI